MEINIFYGISNMSEDAMNSIRSDLGALGCRVKGEKVRGIKAGIDSLVDGYSQLEDLVLVLMLNLENKNPFTMADLLHYQKMIPSIRIVLVVDSEDKGGDLLKAMSDNGLYLAIYAEETDPKVIASLIVNGRTAVEAKEYYGVSTFVPKKTLTLDSALNYMKQDVRSDKEYVERLGWVHDSLPSEKMFVELIKVLPANIKEVLAESERYAGYLRDYIAATTEAKERNPKEKMEADDSVSVGTFKNVVTRAVRRAVIGVAGTQHHIGTTHQALLIAHCLGAMGYRVAVVEDYEQSNGAFMTIAEERGASVDGMFKYQGVDYYPDFSMDRIAMLNVKSYNFIVVDFGVFSENMIKEFERCSMQVIVTGIKSWETSYLNTVFDMTKKEELKTYNFLFMSVPIHMRKKVIREMGELSHVFFSEYEPNPFSQNGYPEMQTMLSDFVVGTGDGKKKGLLDKVRGYFS